MKKTKLKLKWVGDVPRCPCCDAVGIHQEGITWSCSVAIGYLFREDCDVEAERQKWEFKKVIKNGKIQLVHVLRTKKMKTKLSELS